MKNVIIANYQEDTNKGNDNNKKQSIDVMLAYLIAQVENSLSLGWKPNQLIVATNFKFNHKEVQSIIIDDLNETCLTGSKTFALKKLFTGSIINEIAWVHDLDAWQIDHFSVNDMKDIAISSYGDNKLNGGSVFYRPAAFDIVSEICNEITKTGLDREEPALNRLLRADKNGKFADRTTVLDTSYNLGCSGYKKRFELAKKPIKVCHFHPTNRIAWDTFVRDRDFIGESAVDDRLYNILTSKFMKWIKKYNYDNDRGHKGNWERPNLYQNSTTIPVPKEIEAETKPAQNTKIDKKTGIWSLKQARNHKHDYMLAGCIASLYSTPSSAIDVGCGDGTYTAILQACGWNIMGIEGTSEIAELSKINNIEIKDLSKPIQTDKFDFVMCLEVGEHIPKESESIFIENIIQMCSKDLVLSWATPGQGGRGHVNEQPLKYVYHQFKIRGFEMNEQKTEFLRTNSTFEYFQNNILAMELKC